MIKKQFNEFTYILGNFNEIKLFCDANNLTMLKAPKERLTQKGKKLFESYEYYTAVEN